MKALFIILFLPLYTLAQTVHINDDKIEYKGKIKTTVSTNAALIGKAQQVISSLENIKMGNETASGKVKGECSIRLNTPYPLIRNVYYTLELSPTDEGLEYKIDNVYMIEQQRGEEAKTIPSEKILEQLEETGPIASHTEKLLNEIDMKLQKVIAELNNKIKSAVATTVGME